MRSMLQLKLLLVNSFLLCSCQTYKLPNITPWVELPGDQSGFGVETVTHVEHEMFPEEWANKRKGAVLLFSEDWRTLKLHVRKTCHTQQCENMIGALDGLFQAIDAGINKTVR